MSRDDEPDMQRLKEWSRQTDDPWDTAIYLKAERRGALIGIVIIIGWIVSGVIGGGIVFVTAYLALSGAEVPDVLSNWGGVIIGFYFGQFFSLIKDYMSLQFDLQKQREIKT